MRVARWRLGADEGRRYAAVSGDRNPIHLSVPTARALGQPRPVAHGMDTAARALALVGAARGDAFTWSVGFASPVRLPGSVAVTVQRPGAAREPWVLTGRHPRTGRHHLRVEVVPTA